MTLKQLTLIAFAAATISSVQKLNAQAVGDELITSDVIITQAITDHDNKNYEDAIEGYKKISKNDTNYVLALYELTLSYIASKDFDKTIDAARKGITLNSKFTRLFYVQLATAYDEKGMLDSALYYYAQAIKKYPSFHKLYFEAGVACVRAKNDSAALRYFTKSIQVNPFHAGSHLGLAELAARNNNPSASIMAYVAFLLLENTTDRSINALVNLEKVCNNEYPLRENPNPPVAGFSDYDEIIKSRAAQVSTYKTKVKLNYFNIIKQVQVLCEKLKVDDSQKDIYNKFHAKLLADLWKKDHFEGMIYSMFSGLNSQEVQDVVKKYDSKIKDMNSAAYIQFNDYRQSFPYNDGNKTYPGKRWFYDNGSMEACGVFDDAKKMSIGEWTYFYNQGQISVQGSFNAKGNKEGLWKYYYEDGTNRMDLTFKDKIEHGPYKTYYTNGQVKEEGTYENGKVVGELTGYYPGGGIKYKTFFTNDVRNGLETNYYETGVKKDEVAYVNGKLQGKAILYFDNGMIDEERTYENNQIVGATKGYYKSGKLYFEGNYQANKPVGEWKWYHENGKLSKVGSFKGGEETGKWLEYWDNGKKSVEYDVRNGSIDGIYKLFDYYNERVYLDAEYDNGVIKKYKYTDATGKVLSEGETKKGKLKWDGYHYNGELQASGEYVDGKKSGKWVYYDITGAKESESEYKDGELDGLFKEYYPSGVLSKEIMYKKGMESGYFQYYHENGKLRKAGYTKDDKLAGELTQYYSNGNIADRGYYINGDFNGSMEYFDVLGKKTSEDLYELDLLKEHHLYDTTGKNYETIILKNGSGDLIAHHPNGKLFKQMNYKYGYKSGTSTIFFSNGNKKSEAVYKNGVLNGALNEWYADGKKYTQAVYKDGEIEGEYLVYEIDETPTFKTQYIKGERNGKREWYYSSGKIKREGNYKDDNCEGDFIYYDEDGTIQMKITYEMGTIVSYSYLGADGKYVPAIKVKNGTANMVGYYPNGKKSIEMNYIHNQRNGKYIVYSTSGTKRLEIDMKNENYEGLFTEWYANGKMKTQETYFNDELNGVSKTYNDKGILILESTYVLGDKYGPEKIYDNTGKLIKTINYIDAQPF